MELNKTSDPYLPSPIYMVVQYQIMAYQNTFMYHMLVTFLGKNMLKQTRLTWDILLCNKGPSRPHSTLGMADNCHH